jgi:hypothetical protein
MDHQKDIQKNEGIVKFVESQATKTNPFGDNRVGERAYRRAERISAAVFLLTSHVSDTEPLKIRSRQVSLGLLDAVLAVRSEMRSVNSDKITLLKIKIRELISLTRMCAISGVVSFQNTAVVAEALDELSSFLAASQRSNLSETVSFSKEDFLDTREQYTAQQKNIVHELSENKQTVPNETKEKDKDTVLEKETHHKGHDKVRTNGRTQAIVEALRTGGELGIRDIASQLPEFSEKMIQRELANLVSKGVVKKAGEKRWSRYQLIAA